MPYYVSLWPEDAIVKRGIDLRLLNEAVRIDCGRKTVSVHDLYSGKILDQEYGKLIISTGARAIKPDLPGISLPGIFPLKEFQNGIDLKAFIEREKPRRGVIIGGGYIGIEMSETFGRLGMEVLVVEALPRVMTIMDDDMASLVSDEMESKGVKILTGKKVVGFEGKERIRKILLDDGNSVEADVVLLSIGVAPESGIAGEAGLELGERKAIKVDHYLKTSDPDIYAAGDCSTAYHRVLKRDVFIPLGLTANRQGRMCGENIVAELIGKEMKRFPGIVGTAITKVFDIEVGKTGVGNMEIERYELEGISSAKIKAKNLPGYYPGATDMWVKLYFEGDSKVIVGGQIVGKGGSAMRLNTLVAAVTARLTLDDLYSLDMAYAPPFSPVWDPLLIAAKIAMK
jgi:NADPH-dependent 2,4-dienoyl-CoA reductase/sulfur reductase-like enzyme